MAKRGASEHPAPQGGDSSEIFHQRLSSGGKPVGEPVAGLPKKLPGSNISRRGFLFGAATVGATAAVRGGREILDLQGQVEELQRQATADFETQYAIYGALASSQTDFVLDGFREIAPGTEFVYPTAEPPQIDPALLLRNDVLTALGNQETFREIFYTKPSGDGSAHIEEKYVSRTDAYRNLLTEFRKAGVARGIPQDSLIVYIMAYAFSRPFQDEVQTTYQQVVQHTFDSVDRLIEFGNGLKIVNSLSLSPKAQNEILEQSYITQMGIMKEWESGDPTVITMNFLLRSFQLIAGEKAPE